MEKKKITETIDECIQRMRKGHEILLRYQQNCDEADDVLNCVLRGDTVSMTKLFGPSPKSIKEMHIDGKFT